MLNIVRKLFIIVPALVIILSPLMARANRGGGVVDGGGGGDFIFINRDEVEGMIHQVWSLYLDQSAANPLNVAYRLLEAKPDATEEEVKVARILRKIMSVPNEIFFPFFGTPVHQYLGSKKLRMPDQELCAGPQEKHFLASVSSLNRDGQICVSVFGLMRLPSGAVRTDILALIAHELAHLNGYGEEDALILQKFFLKESKLILRKGTEDIRSRFAHAIWANVTSQWTVMVNYNSVDFMYLRRLQSLQYESHKAQVSYFEDIVPGDDIEIARPDLWPSIRDRLNNWRTRLKAYGSQVGGAFDKDNRTRLTPENLLTVRALALDLVEVQREVDLYFFGNPKSGRSSEYFEQEKKLIEQATDPRTLTDPSLRPVLICPPKPEKNFSSWGKAHPIYNELFEKRCNSGVDLREIIGNRPKTPVQLDADAERPIGPDLDDIDFEDRSKSKLRRQRKP